MKRGLLPPLYASGRGAARRGPSLELGLGVGGVDLLRGEVAEGVLPLLVRQPGGRGGGRRGTAVGGREPRGERQLCLRRPRPLG